MRLFYKQFSTLFKNQIGKLLTNGCLNAFTTCQYRRLSFGMILAILFLTMSFPLKAQTGSDPFATWLQSIPHPVFNPANKLKPLTYTGWGWQLSNTVVQLAKNYGYAVNFGGATPYWIKQTKTTGTLQYSLAQLGYQEDNFIISDSVIKTPVLSYLPAPYNTNNPITGTWFGKAFYCTNAAGQYVDAQGRCSDCALYYVTNGVTNGTFYPVQSPCFPDAELQRWTDCQILTLKQLGSNCPISVIFNDGEWGLLPYSSAYKAFWNDPRFIADMAALGITNTIPPTYVSNPKIFQYLSQQKARELNQLTDAIKSNFPGVFYFYYATTMEKFRIYGWSCYNITNTLDNMNSGDGWDSSFTATNFTYPTSEVYYKNSNIGMVNKFGAYGFDAANGQGLLLQYLNWKAWNIKQGRPLSYDYVTSGWTTSGVGTDATGGTGVYPDNKYIGFLKCLYTLGMVGANMGWYGNDGSANSSSVSSANFNAPFSTNNVPEWMSQMVVLSRVHAQFSWLQDYLFDGSLVPSPYTNPMSWDLNNYDFAPETYVGITNHFPGGYIYTNTAHVFVRKKNNSNNWLLTAWTSADTDELVTVTVPTLGTVTLNARTNGAVYLAATAQNVQDSNNADILTTQIALTLQDTNGLYPTVWRSQTNSLFNPPSNLRLDNE